MTADMADMADMANSGFFTDATLCIGCKACEVACKEWNQLPAEEPVWSGFSYDNTLGLGATTWRHVKFVEDAPLPGRGGNAPEAPTWQFSSDVCKHCEVAGCLEACPTGAIVRTDFGSVLVQPDVCNGCGYCVVACPFGVLDRLEEDGRVFKCTFCDDRQRGGLAPACASVCPTESIQFGDLDELRDRAERRLETLHARGMTDAMLWDPQDTSVGGTHAFFLVRGDPRRFNLPPQPEVPQRLLRRSWSSALVAGTALVAGALLAFRAGGTA